ncbi:hypothetical protein [Largemouth bass virus]|uniref:AAA-ATPase n=1 Tax=Largemouth bass virus TaxID=176656 RepID=A0A9E7PPF5_9VIRU|nr:hypothetical protein [Mandarin fish ranavirus]QJE49134.1 hypothetical protein LMBV_071 [Largemouth bass virus]WHA35576.1 hypothetical protein MSRaV_88R [Micropterus salmoides ranavirus]WHA35681.1 hypothetical protein SCRaV_88R [Siniperca chuatsi ranavirus]QJE49221.1 putative AAA-ATPase [Largemouth bass virus]
MDFTLLLNDISAWECAREKAVSFTSSPPVKPKALPKPKTRRISKRSAYDLMPESLDERLRVRVANVYNSLWPLDKTRPTVEKQAILLCLVVMADPSIHVTNLAKEMRVKGGRLKLASLEAVRASRAVSARPPALGVLEKYRSVCAAAAAVVVSKAGLSEGCWSLDVTCLGIAMCCANYSEPFRTVWKNVLERLCPYAPEALLRQEYGPTFECLLCPDVMSSALERATGVKVSGTKLGDSADWIAEFAARGQELVKSTVQGLYLKSAKNLLRMLVYEKYFCV